MNRHIETAITENHVFVHIPITAHRIIILFASIRVQ